ncbi:MAG: amidohydrolase family protein [Halanaerobiales bacterium]
MNNNETVIDTHVHITPSFILKDIDKYRKAEPYFDLLSSSPHNKNITGENLQKQMDKLGIDKAVIFGFGFQSMELCKKVNDYIIKMVEKYPDDFIGFAVLKPGSPGVEKELLRCKNAGLKGVGELFPRGQKFDITDKKSLAKIAEFCQQYNWPLLIHLNEPVGHYYKGKTEDSIKQGEKLAEHFPGTTFIYAHLGGGLCFYELMPEMAEKLKNVFYDTAAVPFLYNKEVYKTLKTIGNINKIILGTDYPLISPEKYINDIKKSGLNSDEVKKILHKNISQIIV